MQSSKPDKLPHIFLVSAARFQVRDVRQPFLFGRNIGELLELRGRQAVFFKRNQVHVGIKPPKLAALARRKLNSPNHRPPGAGVDHGF